MPAKPTYHVTLPFEVRDYECDLQGIVNNAVYQQYLEHARHTWLKQRGMDFAALTRLGIHLVVVQAELRYKRPLKSGDRFVVESHLRPVTPVRFVFDQRICKEAARADVVLEATITCAAMNQDGKPLIVSKIPLLQLLFA